MADSITFYDSHKPKLEDGKYTVTVTHTVGFKDNAPTTQASQVFTQSLDFHVSGPRFDLDRSLIYSVYPPVGGKGDYMADLPSLVLNRSTLPWERSPGTTESTDNSASWLFLLLVDETETETWSVKEHNGANISEISQYLISESNGKPPLTNDDMSTLPAKINYLEVAPTLSAAILPRTLNDLQYLSYARKKGADASQVLPEGKAVLLCNRLPQQGHNSTVYLISVENNYAGSKSSAAFSGIKNEAGNHIFPYMYKWQFHAVEDRLYCITPAIAEKIGSANPTTAFPDLSSLYDTLYHDTEDFEAALKGLKNPDKSAFTDADSIKIIERAAFLPGSTFHGLLANLAGGFAPFTTNASAADITRTGAANLPYHQVDAGGKGVSASAWYRGPLASGAVDLSGTGLDYLVPSEIIIYSGETYTLNDVPSGATLVSSDKTIATTQNDGSVTGVSAGTCTITIAVPVKVIADASQASLAAQSKSASEIIIYSGETYTLYDVPPVAKLTSTDNEIATTQNDGSVTGVSAGTCTITIAVQVLVIIDADASQASLAAQPKSPKELILKDTSGNYDLSYAAAFELGRVTALNDVDFATEFYKWKNETAMALRLTGLKGQTGYKDILHLPLTDTPQIKDMPRHVVDKFTSWKILKYIPFRYLVPDPGLLPNESIRFFRVDIGWVNAFICGAFSIGHTVEADLSGYLNYLFANREITGFLINSLAVSGWPDFEVDATPSDGSNLSLLRKDDLDVNIRLYLLSGKFSELKFHLNPGKLHSGFLYENGKCTKSDGTIDLTSCISSSKVVSASGILSSGLIDKSKQSVAQFAAKMMEGTPTVVFTIK